jgi:hypothetical protein
MSVPASRDAPCNETIYRYFKFKQFWFCECIKISRSFILVILCAPSRTLLAHLFRKLRSRRCCLYGLRRSFFHSVIGSLNLQYYYRAFFAFQTYRIVGSGFPSLAAMLKNYCQPYDDHGVLCHATSLHELVPPIKRSRVLGG